MDVSSIALSGLWNAESQLGAAATSLARAVNPEAEVDFPQAIAELIAARLEFLASLRVVRVSDETTGALLDVFA